MLNKNKKTKLFLKVTFLVAGFLFCNFAFVQAAPSNEITYHGKLTDTSDIPVADGSYDFKFRIYDAVTGGNCLWSARGTCGTPTAKSLTVNKGVFYTILGESGDNALSLDFNSDYWIEITVGTDSAMSPRRKVTATGYSLNSGRLNGQSSTYYLDTSATEQTKSGNLNLSSDLALTGVFKDKDGDAGTAGQVLSSTVTGTDWVDASSGGTSIFDADSDTGIQTEESADEDIIRFDTAGGERMIIDGSGNVGIGGTPSQQLEITGDFEVPNTTYADQSGIIYKDGVLFIHNFNYGDNGTVTTVGQNTFVGKYSGNLTMGATATDAEEASYNTAIGYNTLTANTIGAHNTAFGRGALYNNTTGDNNNALGNRSLYTNTTGYSNSAVGQNALFSNQDGYYNMAIGESALSNNTSGHSNAAIGRYSMGNNTTGDYNIGIGRNALMANTTGNYNTAIGTGAGRFIADGATPNQTSGTSVYIGGESKANADGDANEIVIGYNTIGNGSNTATLGNDNITATYLKGQLNLDNYTFPTADGSSADQILKTNGSGTLSWADNTFVDLTDTTMSSYTAGSVLFTSSSAVTEDNSNLFWDDTSNELGIGTNSPNSKFHLNGSFAVKRTSTATDVNTDDEVIIGVTDTSVARTITLDTDDVVAGRIIIIKDESGVAGTNNITIDTEGSENIDGQSSVSITSNYGVIRAYSDGSNWFLF